MKVELSPVENQPDRLVPSAIRLHLPSGDRSYDWPFVRALGTAFRVGTDRYCEAMDESATFSVDAAALLPPGSDATIPLNTEVASELDASAATQRAEGAVLEEWLMRCWSFREPSRRHLSDPQGSPESEDELVITGREAEIVYRGIFRGLKEITGSPGTHGDLDALLERIEYQYPPNTVTG